MSKIIVLDKNSQSVQYLKNKDKRLAKVIDIVGDITYKPYENGYVFLVHEIIEQMLSIKAGAKIFERLEKMCNGNITPEQISKLSYEDIKSIGTSNAKVLYIQNLTNMILNGELDLESLKNLSDDEVYKKLICIKGVGSWTIKMYLIFVLNREDILPFEDVAFIQAYKWMYNTNDRSKVSMIKKCKKWEPYSSIAARYLYRALDSGLTKNKLE